MNVKRTRSKGRKISKQTLELRKQLWPEVTSEDLWDRRERTGFITIPRTMPMLLQIMDDVSPKGKPVSSTYLALWCRLYDESMVTINNEMEVALESGFSGQRATSTWASRIAILSELGFISVKPGSKGPRNYVLVYNPYNVVKSLNAAGKVQEQKYIALFTRAQEVGANDLREDG